MCDRLENQEGTGCWACCTARVQSLSLRTSPTFLRFSHDLVADVRIFFSLCVEVFELMFIHSSLLLLVTIYKFKTIKFKQTYFYFVYKKFEEFVNFELLIFY